jgi:hypothetical protein
MGKIQSAMPSGWKRTSSKKDVAGAISEISLVSFSLVSVCVRGLPSPLGFGFHLIRINAWTEPAVRDKRKHSARQ